MKGRMMAKLQGDFVVFLIDIRPNYTMKLSLNFKKAGDAMQQICRELETQPELGCLGTETISVTGRTGQRY